MSGNLSFEDQNKVVIGHLTALLVELSKMQQMSEGSVIEEVGGETDFVADCLEYHKMLAGEPVAMQILGFDEENPLPELPEPPVTERQPHWAICWQYDQTGRWL